MAKVLSVRVDDDLAAWVEGYAVERGVRRAQVLEGALREFRGLCASGVPDLPEVKAGGRPRAGLEPAAMRAEDAPLPAGPSPRVQELERRAMEQSQRPRRIVERETTHAERRALVSERQALLNDGKYGKGAW